MISRPNRNKVHLNIKQLTFFSRYCFQHILWNLRLFGLGRKLSLKLSLLDKNSAILHIYFLSHVEDLVGDYAISELMGFFSIQVFYFAFMVLSKMAYRIAKGNGILENTKRQTDCTDCSEE